MNRSLIETKKENIIDKTKKKNKSYLQRNWKKYGVGLGVAANIIGSSLTWNEIRKLKQKTNNF